MKKKAIAFVPLGRKPKDGELYRWKGVDDSARVPIIYCCWPGVCTRDDAEAVERREVDVECPDPEPEWIAEIARNPRLRSGPCIHITPEDLSAAFRAHVNAQANPIAARIRGAYDKGCDIEALIRDGMLR